MIKVFLTILSVYLIYYAGNIFYDLVLKKDKSEIQDDTEEYSLSGLKDNTDVLRAITIDDVENINTPDSFTQKEPFPTTEEDHEEGRDPEYWRSKFESENDIDEFDELPESKEKAVTSAANPVKETQNSDSDEHSCYKQFYQFLNLAETTVQVLADLDGYKVYHSII